MAGFQFNGCGAKDYFKKKKYLGEQMCPNCKKMAPFYLEQAKFKVSVFFVPTVTLKERYAIMCEKCGTGHFIEEERMHRIMAGQEDGLDLVGIDEPPEPVKVCPKCGAMSDGPFCGVCGAKIDEPPIPEPKRICPNCGAEVSGKFCGNCGAEYKDPGPVKPTKKICLKCGAEVSGLFCDKCGTRYGETGEVDEPDYWECVLCGTRNPLSATKCSLCDCEK